MLASGGEFLSIAIHGIITFGLACAQSNGAEVALVTRHRWSQGFDVIYLKVV